MIESEKYININSHNLYKSKRKHKDNLIQDATQYINRKYNKTTNGDEWIFFHKNIIIFL